MGGSGNFRGRRSGTHHKLCGAQILDPNKSTFVHNGFAENCLRPARMTIGTAGSSLQSVLCAVRRGAVAVLLVGMIWTSLASDRKPFRLFALRRPTHGVLGVDPSESRADLAIETAGGAASPAAPVAVRASNTLSPRTAATGWRSSRPLDQRDASRSSSSAAILRVRELRQRRLLRAPSRASNAAPAFTHPVVGCSHDRIEHLITGGQARRSQGFGDLARGGAVVVGRVLSVDLARRCRVSVSLFALMVDSTTLAQTAETLAPWPSLITCPIAADTQNGSRRA